MAESLRFRLPGGDARMSDAAASMLLERLSTLIRQGPFLILIGALLLSVPVAWYATGIEFRDSFDELLEKDHPAVRDLNAVAGKTGGSAFIVVAAEVGENLGRAQQFIDALEPTLRALPDVLRVECRVAVEFLEERQLLYLSADEIEALTDDVTAEIDSRYAEKTGLFVDLREDDEMGFDLPEAEFPVSAYKVGKDGKYVYAFVRLRGSSGDLSFGARVLEAVVSESNALRDKAFPGLGLLYSGSVLIRAEENRVMQEDLKKSSVLGFCAVVLLLTLYTRRLRTLLLVSVALLVGAAWTFAFARAVYGHLNIITGFLAPMMFGLGVDFVIHLFLRYTEARNDGEGPDDATDLAITRTGRAVISGAITTAAAFFVIRFANFRGYTEFGVLAAGGVLAMLIVALVVFPALNLSLERKWPIRPRAQAKGWLPSRPIRALVLVAVPVFALFSAYRLYDGGVVVHTNWRELKGESPASDFDDYIIESLGTSNSTTLVYVENPKDLRNVLNAIDDARKARALAQKPSGIKSVISPLDLVPEDQDERIDRIQEFADELRRVKPDRLNAEELKAFERARALTEVQPFEMHEVPASLRQLIETPTGNGALIVIQTPYLFYEVSELISWADEMMALRTVFDERGLDAFIMSENWVAGSVFAIIVEDGPFILWAAFLGVFLVLLIDLRSLKHTVVVTGSLAIGVISIAGAMALTGIELNFINAVVVPSLVGIGIDGAIHCYHRFLEEGPDSVPRVLRHTSPATLLAASTTMLGFGAMIVARHAGIRSVGALAILGITTTYLCTSVFFPLALHAVGKRLASQR